MKTKTYKEALQDAKEIVKYTDKHMRLEGQGCSQEFLEKEVRRLTRKIYLRKIILKFVRSFLSP